MDEILFASTTTLAAAIRQREVSASEVLEAHLAQIAHYNPALNAIIYLDAEAARRRAREADAALARGEVWGPLHGVPFTLKDCHSTADMPTTSGYPPLADYRAPVDGTIAARLRAAGGVLMGKTNVSLLLSDIQSDNPIFGRTNNPWNPARTSGGSSGGAAAALATGMTPFEIGSDIGGSIRIPSHFNGTFGLKPTEHRVSVAGHIPDLPDMPRAARTMNVIGPMARDVDDLILLFGLIAGPDGRDTDVPPVPVRPVERRALKSLRLAWAPTFPGVPAMQDVQDALRRLAGELDRLGVSIAEALPPLDFEAQKQAFGRMIRYTTDSFLPPPEGKAPFTLADYYTALHQRDAFIIAWEAFLAEWDALLCPVSAFTAFPHCPTNTPLTLDGETVEYWTANWHCKVFNFTGHPAVILPVGRDHDGLPIGIQVVGRRWEEERLLGVALALAEVTGPFVRPPGY